MNRFKLLALIGFALVALCGWRATVMGVSVPAVPVAMGAFDAAFMAVVATGITRSLRRSPAWR